MNVRVEMVCVHADGTEQRREILVIERPEPLAQLPQFAPGFKNFEGYSSRGPSRNATGTFCLQRGF